MLAFPLWPPCCCKVAEGIPRVNGVVEFHSIVSTVYWVKQYYLVMDGVIVTIVCWSKTYTVGGHNTIDYADTVFVAAFVLQDSRTYHLPKLTTADPLRLYLVAGRHL